MAPPKAVIFDLDGTLTDTMPMHASAWETAFRDCRSMALNTVEAYLREGEKGEDFARYILAKYSGTEVSDRELEPLVSRYIRALTDIYEVRFFDGAQELIHRLAESSLLALVSGSKNVRERLAPFPEFLTCFDAVISGDDTAVGKPHPAPYEAALRTLGVPAASTIVVENAPFGIRSAVSAGARVWVVKNNSPLGLAELLSLGAERAFPDLAAITDAFYA